MSNEGIRPLCKKFPQLSRYVKYFNSNNKCMEFLVRDEKLLKTYNAIWDKSSNLLEKGFDSESVHNKYIKSKIKFYNGKINTNFYGNKIPGENICCVCLSAIILDNYYYGR